MKKVYSVCPLDIRFFCSLYQNTSLLLSINLIINKMKIRVNNKEVETQTCNLQQLSQELNFPQTGIAVAVNNRMIPRAQWEHYILNEHDDLIIIKAVCGG